MSPDTKALVAHIVSSVAAAVGAVASIRQLPNHNVLNVFQGFVVLLLLISIVIEIWSWRARRPKSYAPQSRDIVEYMRRWLGKGARSAVFTRDLSWADDQARIQELLKQKSRGDNLVLFVGRSTAFIDGLRAAGAEVYDYSELDFEPKSRFTIIDYGKSGARIAIGSQVDGKHVINEYDSSDPGLFDVASDLVNLARKVSRRV